MHEPLSQFEGSLAPGFREKKKVSHLSIWGGGEGGGSGLFIQCPNMKTFFSLKESLRSVGHTKSGWTWLGHTEDVFNTMTMAMLLLISIGGMWLRGYHGDWTEVRRENSEHIHGSNHRLRRWLRAEDVLLENWMAKIQVSESIEVLECLDELLKK